MPVQLFCLVHTLLFQGNLYARKKNGKLPLKVNSVVEQAQVTQ